MKVIDSFSGEYRFLSNFWLAPVEYEGLRYKSTEHAFQAAKTLDEDERLEIQNASSTYDAKKLGGRVNMRADWEAIRIQVMEGMLRQKFRLGTINAVRLEETGEAELIEGNWWNDTFWGVCEGVGENNLGKLLMKIRADNREKLNEVK